MITPDFIVVGQGLAGSILAMKLIGSGLSVVVIDKPELSMCSKVAAGIWNPVVFKRLSKSWKVDEVLPEMYSFYRKAETDLGTELITERNIIKLFSEQQEIDLWIKKANGELNKYLDKTIYTDPIRGIRNSSLGYSKVLNSGNLDVNAFLSGVRKYLAGKESYLEERFDHQQLETGTEIRYKNITAKGIIFSEGYLIKDNPFFNYVPMKPAKGEVIKVELDEATDTKDIINKNSFLMPLNGRICKAGATYNWKDLNDTVSAEGLEELKDKLKRMLETGFNVITREAGVRPSVIDRRPVLGSHPKHKNVYLFSGMGTKGVMLAPYFAQRMADHIHSGKTLEDEVNLSRFDRFFGT